jgi:hypothetical protein
VFIAVMNVIESAASIGTKSSIMYFAVSLISSIVALVPPTIVPYFVQWRRLRLLSGVSLRRRRELGAPPSLSPPAASAAPS